MISNYIPQAIIVAAVVAIVILIARKVPTVKKQLDEEVGEISVVEKRKRNKEFWDKVGSTTVAVAKGAYSGIIGAVKGVKSGYSTVKDQAAKKGKWSLGKPGRKMRDAVPEEKPEEPKPLMPQKEDDSDSGMNAARKLKGEGKLKDAEQAYIDIILKDPKDCKPYEELGRVYEEQGNHKDAAQSLDQALKLGTPNEKNVNAMAAKCYFESKSHRNALEHAEKAVELNERDTDSLAVIAKVHARNKNSTMERITWEKVMAFDPENKEAKERLAEFDKE